MISIVIPVYNEEIEIENTINQLKDTMTKLNTNYEIIVVNDGSIDNTKNIVDKINGIKLINHAYNLGYGASLKHGIEEAKYEKIVMLDADGTYPISEIPNLLKYSDDYDIVSGARTKKGVKIPLLRRPAKLFLTKIANFVTGKKIPDLNCGLRVIKKSNVKKFFNILPQRFSFTITHLLSCITNGYTVKYVPIDYFERKGKSSIKSKNFLDFINLIIRMTLYFKPEKIFGTISGLLLLAAIVAIIYSRLFLNYLLNNTIIILAISSLFVFLFGLIAHLIVKNREL